MPGKTSKDEVVRKQVRGSAVMLFGRLLALGLNLLVHVLVVRYLTKAEYGSFAFAIAMVAVATNILLLGLDKALSRFMAIYHESDDFHRMAGTVVFVFCTVIGFGLGVVALVFGFQHVLGETLITDPLSLTLLLTMIVLAPVEGLNSIFQAIFGVFGEVGTVFFRRYILGPLLKLGAIIGVIIWQGSPQTLALCYLIAAIAGVGLYLIMFIQTLKREKLTQWFKPGEWIIPGKEIFLFSLPLLSNQLGFLSRTAFVVIFLEAMHQSVAVADFRSVIPFARLNLIVISSFAFLYTPLASRMFSRHEKGAINDLYWTSAIWVVVLTFPALMLTSVFAHPLVVAMFDQRYASSSFVLALMSIGFFFDAAFGFTVQTLRVQAKVGCIVTIDLLTILVAISLFVLLIPRYGALGAAWGAMLTMAFQNLTYFVSMKNATGLGKMEWKHVRAYGCILFFTAILLATQLLLQPNLPIACCLIAAASLVLLISQRETLQALQYFPELIKLPVIGPLLASGDSGHTISSRIKP